MIELIVLILLGWLFLRILFRPRMWWGGFFFPHRFHGPMGGPPPMGGFGGPFGHGGFGGFGGPRGPMGPGGFGGPHI